MGPNPYVFVVGCPRSGTTLLQRLLDHHPSLVVANDTHIIRHVLKHALRDVPPGVDPPLTPSLIDTVVTYRRFYRLRLPEEAARAAGDGAGSFGAYIAALFDALAAQNGKPYAGEKTPEYVRWLPHLHGLFPAARTIHIIRDGRDVALSLLEWARDGKGPSRLPLWRSEPVGVAALWWAQLVGAGRCDGAALGKERYLEVFYERLVADPDPELRRVVAFLGLEYDERMIDAFAARTRSAPALDAKDAWLPPTQGLRRWREQMPGRDLELFETLAGPTLRELGYGTHDAALSPEIAETVARCRAGWGAQIAARS